MTQNFQPGIPVSAGDMIGVAEVNNLGSMEFCGYLVPAADVPASAPRHLTRVHTGQPHNLGNRTNWVLQGSRQAVKLSLYEVTVWGGSGYAQDFHADASLRCGPHLRDAPAATAAGPVTPPQDPICIYSGSVPLS